MVEQFWLKSHPELFTTKSSLSLQNQTLQLIASIVSKSSNTAAFFVEKQHFTCLYITTQFSAVGAAPSSLQLQVRWEMCSLYSVLSPPWVLLPNWTHPELLFFFLSLPRTHDHRWGLEHQLTSWASSFYSDLNSLNSEVCSILQWAPYTSTAYILHILYYRCKSQYVCKWTAWWRLVLSECFSSSVCVVFFFMELF